MEMSKKRKALFIILGIIFIPFFIYKIYSLKDYNQYPGKVIDIEEVNVSLPKSGYKVRHIPVVEYYALKDTSSFSEGKDNLFASYDIGDEVTVIERKDNPYKSSIFSFWYYFLNIPELIIMLLICFILFGFYVKFIEQKS